MFMCFRTWILVSVLCLVKVVDFLKVVGKENISQDRGWGSGIIGNLIKGKDIETEKILQYFYQYTVNIQCIYQSPEN